MTGVAGPTSADGLGARTASGFAWLFAQTVGSRGVSLASQLALAALLSERAFGLMALATTALAMMQLMQHLGLREILIQRSHKVGLWVRHARHVSIAVGGLASIMTAIAAPIAAAVYNDPGVTGVVLVLALAPLFRAQANVADAVLRATMRFRLVALLELSETLTLAVLGVTLALLDFGEYALAIPVTAAAMLRLAIANRLAGVGLSRRLEPRRWRMLLSSGGVLLASRFFGIILLHADKAVLGFFHPAGVVGVYFFAMNLSAQGVRMLTMNVVGVLLPALSTMSGDSARLLSAFIRSARSIAVLAVPFGLLQAGLVEPLVALLFPDRWDGLGPIVQVLSIGMVFSVVGASTPSVFLSQRRFTTVLVLAASQCVLFLALVVPSAALGGAFEVAIAVGIYHVVVAPTRVWVAIRPLGGSVRGAAGVFVGPVASGMIGAGAGLALGWAAADGWPLDSWLGAGVAVGVALPVYGVVVFLTCRATVDELIGVGSALVRRVLGRRSAA